MRLLRSTEGQQVGRGPVPISSPILSTVDPATKAAPTFRSPELSWSLLLIASMVAYVGIMIRGGYIYADDFPTFGFAPTSTGCGGPSYS